MASLPAESASAPGREARLSRGQLAALGPLLRRLPLFSACYAWCKVRLDPVYPLALAELERCETVVDLGAGLCLLELLLADRPGPLAARAVEWHGRKARAAARAAAGLPGITVERGDLRTADLGSPDAVVLLDVLHYFPVCEQRALLERCLSALAPGGLLLIRELDPPPEGASLSVGLERLAVALGLNRGEGVRPWPVGEMVTFLAERNCSVSVREAGRGPFSANALLAARKAP